MENPAVPMPSFSAPRTLRSASPTAFRRRSGPDAHENTDPAKPSLLSLPTEIHLAISRLLIYPDALSLKYTSLHFHRLVDTGIRLKVEWLVERRQLHLECPNEKRCDLRSDQRFCRGSVALLMKRRREHMDCESRPGLGCIIYGTPKCPNRRKGITAWQHWLDRKLTVELRWVLLALVSLLGSWLYAMM